MDTRHLSGKRRVKNGFVEATRLVAVVLSIFLISENRKLSVECVPEDVLRCVAMDKKTWKKKKNRI